MYLATCPSNRAIAPATALLIGAQDFGHFLRVEPRRERGRPDQVDKHHGELAALSFREWQPCSGDRARGGGGRGGVRHRALTQGGSRSE